jgi:hypothetical protein
MSKFDGVLKLVTTNGITLAWNHDYETFDPHLWWRAPADTTAILQVFGFLYPANSDIRLTGGDEAYYRLHLEQTAPPTWSNTTSTNVDLPFEARGTIEKAGEEKRFPFRAHKGDFIEARVKAATLGWPLDPWIKIVNATGQEVAKQDDSDGSPDPRLEWKCGADTNLFFVVGSTLNRGATNYHFELEAAIVPPDFRVTWAEPTVALTTGATNIVKVNVKRMREHTNELIAEFWDLPPGVNANAGSISNKTGEISFTLTAETNAPAFQGPIRIIVTDGKTKRAKAAIVELVTRGENNGVPNGYSKLAIESYDHCWLTVKPAAKPPITTAASK